MFTDTLRQTGNITKSAEAAGWLRSQAYGIRKDDPEFAVAWDSALDEFVDAMEEEAHRRACLGIEEPVIWQGQRQFEVDPVTGNRTPLTLNKKSDQLLMFLLKGNRSKYGTERRELSGPGGGPIVATNVDLEQLTDDELRKLAELSQILASRQADLNK